MKIEEFIEEFNNARDKEKVVMKHITIDYIPYSRKISMCNNIAEFSTHTQVLGEKVFKNDSSMRYMLFVYMIVENYTDIELGQGQDKVDAFDQLERFSVVFFIAKCLGEEYKRLETVLKMRVDDIFTNERDLPAFLETKIESLKMISEKMDELYEQKNKQDISAEGVATN